MVQLNIPQEGRALGSAFEKKGTPRQGDEPIGVHELDLIGLQPDIRLIKREIRIKDGSGQINRSSVEQPVDGVDLQFLTGEPDVPLEVRPKQHKGVGLEKSLLNSQHTGDLRKGKGTFRRKG